MTYTPPKVLIREMERRQRNTRRLITMLLVLNVLLFGFIAYTVISGEPLLVDTPTVEVVE